MIYITKLLKDFKYDIVINPNYKPMFLKNYKKINNTSCIIVWYNPIKNEFQYLIQKRSKYMKHGKSNLAIGGGMLEDYDKTLQRGAVREVMEESQVMFKHINLMSQKTISQLSKNIFYLSQDSVNVTFYLIIVSNKQPKWKGPILKDQYPFKKSKREIDLEDTNWNDKKIKKQIYRGHSFLKKEEIEKYYNKNPKVWKYSKKALNKLFKILENN